jgi:molecular chaperone HscB
MMTSFDLNFARADYFALLGLPRRQALDVDDLERLYREIQASVHPDKHTQGGESDRRIAMQWATKVNEAYLTLKNPLPRARYLLHLSGHDVQLESNTAMPTEFLLQQMEQREAVAEARQEGDIDGLDRMHRRIKQEMFGQYTALQEALDVDRDQHRAGEIVRQLMFQEKLLQEIDEALEAVEA